MLDFVMSLAQEHLISLNVKFYVGKALHEKSSAASEKLQVLKSSLYAKSLLGKVGSWPQTGGRSMRQRWPCARPWTCGCCFPVGCRRAGLRWCPCASGPAFG